MMTTVLVSLIVFSCVALLALEARFSSTVAESYDAITIPVKSESIRDIARSAAYDRRLFH